METEDGVALIKKIYNVFRDRFHWDGYPEKEDMLQIGMLKWLECQKRFDPSQASFETFASRRIYGAMLDEVRTRHMMKPYRPVDGEPFDGRDILYDYDFDINTDQYQNENYNDIVQKGSLSVKPITTAILSNLTERSRLILTEIYINGNHGKHLYKQFGVTQGRISQLRKIALNELRAKLL